MKLAHQKRCANFVKNEDTQGRQTRVCRKRIILVGGLCYSVKEAERWSDYQIARIASTGANW